MKNLKGRGGGVDPNPKIIDALFCLNLYIMERTKFHNHSYKLILLPFLLVRPIPAIRPVLNFTALGILSCSILNMSLDYQNQIVPTFHRVKQWKHDWMDFCGWFS